jgi:hypothetical protein
MNPRKQIRNKVFEIINSKTSFGGRVYLSRKVPFSKDDEAEDGVILVFVEKESASIWNGSPKEYKKTITLSIAIIKSLNSEDIEAIEDQLETVAEEVEKILGKNDTLDGLCSELDYESYESIINEDGEFKEGAIKLTYSITYYEQSGLEEADMDDFRASSIVLKHNDHVDDFKFDITHQL